MENRDQDQNIEDLSFMGEEWDTVKTEEIWGIFRFEIINLKHNVTIVASGVGWDEAVKVLRYRVQKWEREKLMSGKEATL